MEKYNYRRAIADDIKDWIINDSGLVENGYMEDRDEDLYNWIYEEVFDEDSVTGNGAYYYGTEDFCSECLSGNFDILYEAAHEFAIDDEINILIQHYEDKDLARYFDCTIRCYLLMECVYAAVEELIQEGKLKNLTNN